MTYRKSGLLTLAGLTLALCLTTGSAQAQTVINEVRTDNSGTDTDEYFELKGTAGATLVGLHYIVIGDGSTAPRCGVIESVTDLGTLTPNAIQADGFFAACKSAAPTLTGYDVTNVTSFNFENTDNVTHMLVSGFTGTLNQDLDTNDDGVFDITPWTLIVDSIGLLGPLPIDCSGVTTTTSEAVYGPTTIGPDGTFNPTHVYRCTDSNAWALGQFPLPPSGIDTPGAANLSCAALPPTIAVERRNLCAPNVAQVVTVTDSIPGATAAVLHYSINGGAESTVNMTNVGNLWSASIPGQGTNGARVTYYVTASNANGGDTGFTWGYFVGTVTIASLRSNDANGVNIYRFHGARVNAVVTSDNFSNLNVNTDFYVQDATGGINIFQSGLNPNLPARGQDVTVCGVVAQFNGNLELTTSSSVPTGLDIDINGPGTLPAPAQLFTCQIDESKEGLLVKLLYVNADTSGATNAGNWRPNDTSGIRNCPPPYAQAITMFVDDATDIDATPVSSVVFDLTGIVLQNDAASPLDTNYRVAPRGLADINYYLGTSGTPDGGVARLLPLAPNPFSTKASIRFEIPRAATPSALTPVRLSVYDVQGKLVSRLVDDSRAAGAHEVTLNADDLGSVQSGVFFYSLEVAGQKVATQKLVLNR